MPTSKPVPKPPSSGGGGATKKFCMHCGANIASQPPSAKFCAYCGQKL
jgi:membrane protease subunit (stomatin/prohibitin family)